MAAQTGQRRKLSEWVLFLLAITVVGAVCIPLWQGTKAPEDESIWTPGRFAQLLLGPEQIVCYACFTWAALILLMRYLALQKEKRGFALELLPEDEDLRILPEDSRGLQRRVEQMGGRGGPFLLSKMVHMALGKFAVTRSTQDALETVRSQADVELGRLATSMATVHYLAWAIPAIGFVGTVRGIGMALTVAPTSNVELAVFLERTTRNLAVAFDTTLVALILSLILMFFIHSLQREEEESVLNCQQYCLERVVNRLYDLGRAHAAAPNHEPVESVAEESAWPV